MTTAAALLAMAITVSGCSILGDDAEPIAGPGSISAEEASTTTGLQATTANSNATTSESNTDTTEQATSGTGSSGTGASVPPTNTIPVDVSPDGFCEAERRNGFQITFDPGASADVIDSATTPDEADMYKIEVGAKQIMVITLGSADPDAVATLRQPDGTVEAGSFNDATVAPTQAGDYWICITAGESRSDYQLSVSVVDDNTPTKIDAPWCGDQVNDRGEIRFDLGRFSGTVENGVIRGERDLYTIAGNEGQALDLFLASPEFNAVFALRTPSGEILIDEVSDFRIPLPESGTYAICIGATRGNSSYVLEVAIG